MVSWMLPQCYPSDPMKDLPSFFTITDILVSFKMSMQMESKALFFLCQQMARESPWRKTASAPKIGLFAPCTS